MVGQAWLSLGVRFSAGHGLWSIAALLFPSLALAQGESLALAMLLFLTETAAALAVLGGRLGIAWWAAKGDHPRRARLRRSLHGFKGVVLMAVVATGYGVAVVLVDLNARPPGDPWVSFPERARWMLAALAATALLDTIVAPVRAPAWLETGLAWQGSRSSVLLTSCLVGIPVSLVMRSTEGFVWAFLALRLIADVGGLKPGERERLRALMFDPAMAEGPLTARACADRSRRDSIA